MPDRTAQRIEFGRVGRRVVEANFDGGDLSSDAGLMLLRRVDGRIGRTRAQAVALHGLLIEQSIASHKSSPAELVLDVDASDVPLHGRQELAEFHAYYDRHCHLPLDVFCGRNRLEYARRVRTRASS